MEAKRNDSGKYWCFAENEIDANITSVSLDVQCKLKKFKCNSFTSLASNDVVKQKTDVTYDQIYIADLTARNRARWRAVVDALCSPGSAKD